jgi:hypothetical protein
VKRRAPSTSFKRKGKNHPQNHPLWVTSAHLFVLYTTDKRPPLICRDKGWARGWVGALCLSSWQHVSSELRDTLPNDIHPTRTSTRPPHLLHSAPCPYRWLGHKRSYGLNRCIRLSKFVVYGAEPMPHTTRKCLLGAFCAEEKAEERPD